MFKRAPDIATLDKFIRQAEAENFYARLGLEAGAAEDEIKSAYRERAFLHPDRAPDGRRSDYERGLKRVIEAYEVLGDSDKRSRYDRETASHAAREEQPFREGSFSSGRTWRASQSQGPNPSASERAQSGQSNYGSSARGTGSIDPDEIFEKMWERFQQHQQSRGGPTHTEEPRRPDPPPPPPRPHERREEPRRGPTSHQPRRDGWFEEHSREGDLWFERKGPYAGLSHEAAWKLKEERHRDIDRKYGKDFRMRGGGG